MPFSKKPPPNRVSRSSHRQATTERQTTAICRLRSSRPRQPPAFLLMIPGSQALVVPRLHAMAQPSRSKHGTAMEVRAGEALARSSQRHPFKKPFHLLYKTSYKTGVAY